ncbi:uncharacterized protein LOC131857768 [Cryptomeria japonica]|uniref:uncharacterized protein LOC131857768 n=1 Tax=Cryptomeria japonica TaxID=3369 RepID=UPI0027DA5665|nr:uncharacterized protein LOC131857768 [Cryptomeria japonica]
MGYAGPSRCIMCKAQSETVDHLLLTCPFAFKCWRWLSAKLGLITALPNDIKSLFQSWPIPTKESTLSLIMELSPSSLVWEIWKERNHKLFDNKSRRIETILNSIAMIIVDSINYKLAFSLGPPKVFSSWDESIRKNWHGIRIPPSFGKKDNRRKTAIWSPPKPGWIKLNFDGTSRGNSGPSGIGYVIRDHTGPTLRKMAKLIPLDTNNIEEFKALQFKLRDCINHGFNNILVEGDSEIAINAIKRKNTPNWRLQGILESIVASLDRIDNYEAKHIYREANSEADVLLKLAAQGSYLHSWDQGYLPITHADHCN